METEVESMVTVPIQQVSSSVPLLILQSSISHLLNQYLLPVKNHSLQLSPPTSALQQSSSVLEMIAVDPVGSPSSTTIDQDKQSTRPMPQLMAFDHSSSGPVLDEMTSDQIRSDLTPNRQETSVDNIYSDLSHEYQWKKDHPLEQVIDNPTNPVQTKQQLATDPEMCMFTLIVSTKEPKNSKEAMSDSAWIEAIQDELY
ncbi:hypothetical protein Tco_1505078 [Tanacetum coccineum]